jgi:hypothetical protein
MPALFRRLWGILAARSRHGYGLPTASRSQIHPGGIPDAGVGAGQDAQAGVDQPAKA